MVYPTKDPPLNFRFPPRPPKKKPQKRESFQKKEQQTKYIFIMNTLNNKQKAVNSTVKAASSILGFIHASATIVADLSIKGELNLNARFTTNEDGTRLSTQQLIELAQNRILSTQEMEYKIKTKQRPINLTEITI